MDIFVFGHQFVRGGVDAQVARGVEVGYSLLKTLVQEADDFLVLVDLLVGVEI